MRTSHPKPLIDILTATLKQLGLGTKIKQHEVLDLWSQIVGDQISKVTSAESIREGKLFITVKHSVWRNELLFLKQELIQKINSESKDIDGDGFVLQEKVEGTEFAVETWYANGAPILANIDIEAKRKYNEVSDVQTGCSFGLTWIIPVEHPLRIKVNGAFDKYAPKFVRTGFVDLSVIHDHRTGKMYALECCGNRPAYNAFYAILALLKIPIGKFFADYLRGRHTSDIGRKIFEERFAASLRIFNDDKTPDQRVNIEKGFERNFWLWDIHKKAGQLWTTGDESLGITTGTGENPESAFAAVRQNYFKLNMPTKWARDDYDEDDAPGLPLSRYHRMKRLELI